MGPNISSHIFTGKQPVVCQCGRPHKTVEDAKLCQDYHSTRLKEKDQLRQIERMLYNGGTSRNFHPYRDPGPGVHTTRKPSKRDETKGSDEAHETDSRAQEIPERTAEMERNHQPCNETSVPETKDVTPSRQEPSENTKQGMRNRHSLEENPKKEQKDGAPPSAQDATKTNWKCREWLPKSPFSSTEYKCPLHHKHKSLAEADECRNKEELKQRQKHEEQMDANFQQGKANGLFNDADATQSLTPADGESEVD